MFKTNSYVLEKTLTFDIDQTLHYVGFLHDV
jgi:hypothetical protein